MSKKRERESILYKYFISYIAIFAVPLIILGIGFYRHSVVELQKEVERYTLDKVISMRDTLDDTLLETKKIALQISSDEKIKPNRVKINDYHSKNAIDQLNRYWDKNYIDNMFVYFKDDNYLYTVAGKESSNILYSQTLRIGENEGRILTNRLQSLNSIYFMGLSNSESNITGSSEGLLCLYPLPLGGISRYGTVGMIINEKTIKNLAGDIFGSSRGTLFVYDDTMNKLFTLGDRDFISQEIEQQIISMQDLNGISNIVFEDQTLSVISTESRSSGIKFVLAMSPEGYLNRVIKMKRQVIFIICLVISLGVLLAFIFSSKYYRPIKNLFEKVNVHSPIMESGDNYMGVQSQRHANEIDSIEEMIDNIVEKNYGLTEQLNSHQAFVRDQILLMLIKGKFPNKRRMEELLTLYQMEFSYRYFFVVVISIKKEDQYDITASELNLYLNQIANDKFKNGELRCVDTVQGDFVLLLNTSYENSSRIVVENLFREIKVLLQNSLGLKANIGVGGVYEDMSLISRSFMEALSALDYRLLVGYGNIIFFSDTISSDKNIYWYPVEEQLRFAQSIKQGNIYMVRDIIDEIIDQIQDRHLSIGNTRIICFGMINTIVEVLNEFNIKDLDSDVDELTQFTSLEDLKFKMDNVVTGICQIINEKKESQNETLKIAIIEYIHDNYMDNMLSLEIVADKFDISAKYLSRFFKEQMGFNYLDYIKELRINYAKKLLSETDDLIKDIVEQVGYSDVSSFTRTFKEVEGVTPSKYRKMMQNV